MKKLLLSIAVLLVTTTVVLAQSDVKALMVKLEKSNTEITDPKKMSKASTWIKRGDIYKSIAEANYDKIFVGQPVLVLTAALGQPTNATSIPIESIGGQNVRVYQYPTVKVYIDDDNNVAFFEDIAPAMDKALNKALECYNKALEVEPSQTKIIAKSYESLIQATLIDGNNKFAVKKYEEAYSAYNIAAQLRADAIINQDPSEIHFQLARTAMLLTDFARANKNLDILIEKKVLMDGLVLYFAGSVKSELPGMEKDAEAIFIRGIKEFPDNKDILEGLVNLYIKIGENPNNVIPYIKQASEKDPTNINLIIQEGNLYVTMEDYITAISVYQRAIDMDPKFYNSLFNLGFTYYKLSDKCYKELNNIDYTNITATKEKTEEMVKYRKQSVEVLERAFEVDPNSKTCVDLLKALCFSLRDVDPIYMEKYNKYNELNKKI